MVAFGALAIQAQTPVAGYTLIASTGTVITWTTPNDGQLHWFTVFGEVHITSAETGGQLRVHSVSPDGAAIVDQLHAGGAGAGINGLTSPLRAVGANTTVTISQDTSLSPGAAVAWFGLWGV